MGQSVTITAATAPPKLGWRQWRIQIRPPGGTEFHRWRAGTSATFAPKQAGAFAFRARLYDVRLRQDVPWSPPVTVQVG